MKPPAGDPQAGMRPLLIAVSGAVLLGITLIAALGADSRTEWWALVVPAVLLLVIGFALGKAQSILRYSREASRRQEQNLRVALESAGMGVWEWDLEDRTFSCDDRMCALFGIPKAEPPVERALLMSRVHPKDRRALSRTVERAIASVGENVSEFRVILPDGSHRWLVSNGETFAGPDGTPARMVGVMRDITAKKEVERALRRENAFRESIIESTGEGICVWQPVSEHPFMRFTVWNREMTAITGYTIDQINSRGWYQTVFPDPEVAERARLRIERTGQGETLEPEEWELTRSDGGRRRVRIATKMLESEGRQSFILAMLRDVTAQRRAERALRLRTDALEKSLNGFDIVDENGLIIYANEAYLKMWGYNSLDEIIGTSPIEHCEDPSIPEQIVGELKKHGDFTIQFTARRKDGSTFEVLMATRLFKDEEGNQLFMGASIDVTERMRAEAELEQREEQYRAVYNATRDSLLVGTLDGTIVDVNDAACVLHGCERDELVGRLPLSIIPPELHGKFGEFLEGVREGRGVRMLGRGLRKDGSTFPVEVEGSLCSYRGEPHYLAVLRDITERERLEEQLRQAQKIESIGQLAGGVAHDFNNILQTIVGFATMAQESSVSQEEHDELVAEILMAAMRGGDITRQLLAFSRQQPLRIEEVDPWVLLTNLVKMLRRLIGETITLNLTRTSHSQIRVLCDRTQVEQVLVNLCVNARDAMPDGGKISIELSQVELDEGFASDHPWSRAGSFMRLLVRDNGCGMDRETRERIFEPFFTTKPKERGTGLGLSVVYGIIQQHDGFVHVYSEPDRGTTFHVFLPAVQSSQAMSIPEAPHKPTGGNETLLLAEDESAVRRMAERVLTRAGYTVILAVDGAEALRKFREHADAIQLLVLDAVMPEMGGLEACEKIREIKPAVPALFCSGYSEDFATGGAGLPENSLLLQKPYSLDELLSTIRQILAR